MATKKVKAVLGDQQLQVTKKYFWYGTRDMMIRSALHQGHYSAAKRSSNRGNNASLRVCGLIHWATIGLNCELGSYIVRLHHSCIVCRLRRRNITTHFCHYLGTKLIVSFYCAHSDPAPQITHWKVKLKKILFITWCHTNIFNWMYLGVWNYICNKSLDF